MPTDLITPEDIAALLTDAQRRALMRLPAEGGWIKIEIAVELGAVEVGENLRAELVEPVGGDDSDWPDWRATALGLRVRSVVERGAGRMADVPIRNVNDIPDAELLGRLVRSGLRSRKEGAGIPRWERVSRLLALGSTFSQQLCRRYGMDPDERVRR